MGIVLEFLIAVVFFGIFFTVLPLCFIFLLFIESILFVLKSKQSITNQSRFLKLQLDSSPAHRMLSQSLALCLSYKVTSMPFYFVNSYLYITESSVYEINPKTKKVLRVFHYDPELTKIKVEVKSGSVYNVRNHVEIVHYVQNLEPSTYIYTTKVPEGYIY